MDTIFETEYWTVNLAYEQSYLGRARIPLKNKKSELSELSEAEFLDLLVVIKKYESALKKAFGATMFNWTFMMNDAYKKRPYSPHVHFHVRPRYDHPVEILGESYTDPNFGQHYNREVKKEVSLEIKKEIIEKIQACL